MLTNQLMPLIIETFGGSCLFLYLLEDPWNSNFRITDEQKATVVVDSSQASLVGKMVLELAEKLTHEVKQKFLELKFEMKKKDSQVKLMGTYLFKLMLMKHSYSMLVELRGMLMDSKFATMLSFVVHFIQFKEWTFKGRHYMEQR